MKKLGMLTILTLFVLPASLLFAQRDTGTIVGTVTDSSGGVIPGVSITMRNVETNQPFSTVTDATGNYAAPLLRTGTYEVAAELTGFKKQTRTAIRLNVQDRIKVDFTLEVGNVSETVEVTGEAIKTQSETSSLGHVVDSKTITELPLNGAQLRAACRDRAGRDPCGR